MQQEQRSKAGVCHCHFRSALPSGALLTTDSSSDTTPLERASAVVSPVSYGGATGAPRLRCQGQGWGGASLQMVGSLPHLVH